MRNKIVICLLAICFIIPCVLCLVGCSITTPKLSVRVADGYIQYNNGKEWNNIVAVEDLESEDGFDLSDTKLEFQVGNTHIQCRVAGSEEWYNLITIDEVVKMAFELMDSMNVGKVKKNK